MPTTLLFDTTNPGKKLTGRALLAWDDVVAGERVTFHARMEVMACFVQDDRGQAMNRARFEKLFSQMTRDEILGAFDQLLEGLGNQAVPLASATPSETGEASPAGQ